MKNLLEFKAHIAAVCGLRFDDRNGEEKLARSLQDRMAVNSFIDPLDYLNQITIDQVEFQCLVELLTINETYFFREAEQIELLTNHIVPRFMARYEGQSKIRILSAGCSSGEEPYSLAMALWERYGEKAPHFCSVNGVDIDNAVLDRAREGIYREFSFRGVPAETRERYFDKVATGWQVKNTIRSQINFSTLNLLAQEMPEKTLGYDIIFFRNVSIYFDESTRKQIQANLASLMKKDGILIVGVTETIANDLDVLPMVEERGKYYFVKGAPPLPEKSYLAKRLISKKMSIGDKNKQPSAVDQPLPVLSTPDSWKVDKATSDIDELYQLVHSEQYAKALPLLDLYLAQDVDNKKALLLKAYILMNHKQFDLAQATALLVLEQDNWSVDALLLLGLVAKWNKQADAALAYFKQAAYACHTCWPAHYYLADLYRCGGAVAQARREYRITLQQVSISPSETGVNVIPIDLPLIQMPRLCEHQLAKLESSVPE